MAIKLSDQYPGRAEAPSVDYPLGSFKNRSAPQVLDGTPLDKTWANDKEGFFQGILAEAEIAADGQPDKVGESQYLAALKQVIANESPSQATESLEGVAKIVTLEKAKLGNDDLDFLTSKKIKDAGFWPLGVGQTSQNKSATDRPFSTNITNTTGRVVEVIVSIGNSSASLSITRGGVQIFILPTGGGNGSGVSCTFTVAPDVVYSVVSNIARTDTSIRWTEMVNV